MTKRTCPYCGHIIDAETMVTGEKAQPNEGDITVCIYCTNHCIFGKDLELRKPTLDENIRLVEHVDNWNIVLKAKQLIKQIREL